MCSINDSETEKIFMEPKPLMRDRSCRKCNQNGAEVVLRGKHTYCRECFLKSTTHKFRATLGKSKIVRAGDAVLIAFSGSAASTALLNLVSVGLNEAVQKRLRFRPYVVFIDEGALLQQTRSERLSIVKQINDHVIKYNFPAFFTSLEQCCRTSTDVEYVSLSSTLQSDPGLEQKLTNLFQISSLTSKEDLLTYLRYQLLVNIATKLQCSKIFVAETATKLATTLLSNVSLGRGAQSPLNICFADERDPLIKVLRPLREFMNKEVVFYNTFQNLTSVFIPRLGTQAPSHSSIQKLTEKFVMELETDYPSTASVVFRTGEKLSLKKNAQLEDNACCMCKAPLEEISPFSSAQQATDFSHIVSTLGPSGFTPSGNQISPPYNMLKETNEIESCCNNITSLDLKNSAANCGCSNNYTGFNLSKIKLSLCYGCRLILKDMSSIDALPIDIMRNIERYSNFKNMKDEISEFLL